MFTLHISEYHNKINHRTLIIPLLFFDMYVSNLHIVVQKFTHNQGLS